MKLFALTTEINGSNQMSDFVRDCFVCLFCPGVGDLEGLNENELMAVLTEAGQAKNGGKQHEAESGQNEMRLGGIKTFVMDMEDGDYILIGNGEEVYWGDLGDYYYVEQADQPDDGSCHRRGVTWLKGMPHQEIPDAFKLLLDQAKPIAKYVEEISHAQMEFWLSPTPRQTDNREAADVDVESIEMALDILKGAMQHGDAERRERAAAAILNYAAARSNQINR